jgi:hypothetical protein
VKGILGLLGLLLSLAVAGFLVKKQLTLTRQIVPALQVPVAAGSQSPASTPTTMSEQPQQVQQQYKQALEGALQQPRTAPDEK